MDEVLMTVSEAANHLGISRGMIHHLIKRGVLTALRLPPKGRSKGHKLYLRATEVEQAPGKWTPRKGV